VIVGVVCFLVAAKIQLHLKQLAIGICLYFIYEFNVEKDSHI